MIYCLGIQYNKLEDDKNIGVIQDIRKLSSAEIDKYSNCLKSVAEYRNLKNSIYLLNKNFNDFSLFISNPPQENNKINSLNEKLNSLLLNVNTVLSNLLFSLTATKNHFYFLLDDIDKDEYKNKTNELYNSDDIYRFVWELRNYAQHFFLPYTKVSINEVLQNESIVKTINFKIDKNELLKNRQNWKKATTYLSSLSESFDIINLVEHAKSELIKIYEYFCNKKLVRIDDDLKILSAWVNEIQNHAIQRRITTYYPCILGLENNQSVQMGKLELELLSELKYITTCVQIPI